MQTGLAKNWPKTGLAMKLALKLAWPNWPGHETGLAIVNWPGHKLA
jgi:hypothetical protein